LNGADLVMVV